MAETPEQRNYLVSGEIPTEDWELALRFLGRLGVQAQLIDDQESASVPTAAAAEVIEDGTLPYGLEKITSPGQYLCQEHIEEFWPVYREMLRARNLRIPEKFQALHGSLRNLALPTPRGYNYRFSTSQKLQYAEELGLKVVKPRSLVGFSDVSAPRTYDSYSRGEAPEVVEVGSFINYMRIVRDAPIKQRPKYLSKTQNVFLSALADHLEAQIEASKTPD